MSTPRILCWPCAYLLKYLFISFTHLKKKLVNCSFKKIIIELDKDIIHYNHGEVGL